VEGDSTSRRASLQHNNDSDYMYDPLNDSATGKFFYLEEHVASLDGTSVLSSVHQEGFVASYLGASVTQEFTLGVNDGMLETDNTCFFFPVVGLAEFVDYGPNPTSSFRNLYIEDPAPPDVSSHLRFGWTSYNIFAIGLVADNTDRVVMCDVVCCIGRWSRSFCCSRCSWSLFSQR
jgi:hypothetical protein